jgi:toxin-antitoxin system PIN domain toxin
MILPDVSVLLRAYEAAGPHHAEARAWWERTLSEQEPVGLPWAVALGFIRVSTHPRIWPRPLTARAAVGHVKSWLALPAVEILEPGPRHAEILFQLLEDAGTAGNLTTDAHLAAIAIENRAVLASTDTDFARFKGLRWINPARP